MKTIYFEKDIPRILATKLAAKCCPPLLYTGLNAVKYNRKLPDPPLPGPNWLRVKNLACGLCGTDVSFFKATTGTSSAFEPIPGSARTFLGHENVGVVVEAGPAVTKFRVGDRVTIREYMSGCGNKDIHPPCRHCAEGNYNLCLNYGEPSPLNLPDTGAGFGDSFLAPEQQLTKIFDELSEDQAVLLEPSCVSVHAVLLDPPRKGENILVYGCGMIGLGIVQALKIVQPDCRIWVTTRKKARQQMAKRLGADHILKGDPYIAASEATGGSRVYTGMNGNKMIFGGFDRIYDCAGGGKANTLCCRLLRPRGTLMKVGHHMTSITFDETPVWWHELKLIGVDAHGMEEWQGRKLYTFELVQEWMRDGIYKTEGFITHRFPLSRYKDAMRLAISNPSDMIKIVLDCRKS